MTQELIVIEKENALTVFTTTKGLDPIIEKIRKEVSSLVPDISTKKGREAIASAAAKVARSKTYLDGVGKELVDRLKEQPKLIDAERKRVRDILDALKDEIRKPLTEWENAEEVRINSIKNIIAAMSLVPEIETGAEFIGKFLNRLKNAEITEEKFSEFAGEAAMVRDRSIMACEKILEIAIKREAEQAELEKLRKESAEREQKEREERRVKEAEERAKKQAEESARKEIEKVQAAAFAAQEEIRLKHEAEEKKRIAEEQKIALDKKKFEEAEEKRINNINHRKKINNEVVAAFVENGIDADTAKKIVILLNKNLINHVSINF